MGKSIVTEQPSFELKYGQLVLGNNGEQSDSVMRATIGEILIFDTVLDTEVAKQIGYDMAKRHNLYSRIGNYFIYLL